MTAAPETPEIVVTRFAPSPTGLLHVGHAMAALFAERAAREAGGRFLLRIEDIDAGRARPEFEAAILDDLAWLGLTWETPVTRQSGRFDAYRDALGRLSEMGLVYPCFCTRRDIRAEIEAAGHAPHDLPPLTGVGPDGPRYPGTCRGLSAGEREARMAAGAAHALRLDMAAATARAPGLGWRDRDKGEVAAEPAIFGDVVLARKDVPTSYHLAVVVDDAAQGVTLVTRGEDLFAATHVHRLLQALLGLPVPDYHHHGLVRAETGERLAKRDKGLTIRELREAGGAPADVRALAGFGAGFGAGFAEAGA